MFRKFIIKLFLLSLFISSNSIYAETLEELEATKNNCMSRGENSYWHEAERICTNTFKYSDEEIIHYVGGWSPQGAKGYGQLYVYSAKDGSLTDLYKGQFLESITYKELKKKDPLYRENFNLIKKENLDLLAEWPGYEIF